jgi:leader peptidase (prepilin peptidase)/N-methyltransferase
VITFIDIDYMIIPNVITYPGIVFGVGLGALQSAIRAFGVAEPMSLNISLPFVQSFSDSMLGIAFGGGTLYLVWWLYLVVRKREGLGLGDIKLLAMLGALLGYDCALATIFIGSVLGSVIGIALIALRRHSFSMHLSFGPYLAIAASFYILNKM